MIILNENCDHLLRVVRVRVCVAVSQSNGGQGLKDEMHRKRVQTSWNVAEFLPEVLETKRHHLFLQQIKIWTCR